MTLPGSRAGIHGNLKLDFAVALSCCGRDARDPGRIGRRSPRTLGRRRNGDRSCSARRIDRALRHRQCHLALRRRRVGFCISRATTDGGRDRDQCREAEDTVNHLLNRSNIEASQMLVRTANKPPREGKSLPMMSSSGSTIAGSSYLDFACTVVAGLILSRR